MVTKNKEKQISKAVIKRLPRYRRYLIELSNKGTKKISSKDFSELIGYTASQIRQDLNNFGGFGQQGYGYNVDNLCDEIEKILGLKEAHKIIVVGLGRLGQTMTSYIVKNEPGFEVKGIFDIKEIEDNEAFMGIPIMKSESMADFIKKEDISIAVLTVPSEKAQVVADEVCEAGIRGIWNFTAVDLCVDEGIAVENVHMSDSLHALTYYIGDAK